MEILVVDGMSTDRTRELVQQFAGSHTNIQLIDNPRKIVPAAMNTGIEHSRGDVIVKADAHSVYPSNYIAKCVHYLLETNADNVGGVLVPKSDGDGLVERAISIVLAHPLGAGNAPHFSVGDGKPRYADTVAFGCYRRSVFDRIGLYNEEITRSSDMDLNTRLRKAGGKILLIPELVLQYFPKPGLDAFSLRTFKVGYWLFYAIKFGGAGPRLRHLAPMLALLLFTGALLAAGRHIVAWWLPAAMAGMYMAVVIAISVSIAAAKREALLAPVLPLIFVVRHSAYAVGSLCGLVRAACSSRFWSHWLAGTRRTRSVRL
jgi:glycosyltransferase involved in cell wall biosynthesis